MKFFGFSGAISTCIRSPKDYTKKIMNSHFTFVHRYMYMDMCRYSCITIDGVATCRFVGFKSSVTKSATENSPTILQSRS